MEQKKYHEDYIPSDDILSKYADVLINFALNGGKGLQKNETVNLRIRQPALPMTKHILKSVLQAGGNLIVNLVPTYGFDKVFYENASSIQLQKSYENISKAIIDSVNHEIVLFSEDNIIDLNTIDSQKIMIHKIVKDVYNKLRNEKRQQGKLGYVLSYYPTKSMSDASGLTIEEYWGEVIRACFLDQDKPVDQRKEVFTMLHSYRDKLTNMNIQSLHITGEDVDLNVKIGSDRKWLGGTGRNIPSFELFVSPDWRGTNGWIKFSEPLYENGKLLNGVELYFQDGKVVKAKATEGEDILLSMLQIENFDKLGEFSLTDKRFSRINRFMANALYDENRGGIFGNTHIALGDSYKDSYKGDENTLTKKDFEEKGFNTSSLHVDIISTTDRIVTAKLENGEEKIIYKDGQFILDD